MTNTTEIPESVREAIDELRYYAFDHGHAEGSRAADSLLELCLSRKNEMQQALLSTIAAHLRPVVPVDVLALVNNLIIYTKKSGAFSPETLEAKRKLISAFRPTGLEPDANITQVAALAAYRSAGGKANWEEIRQYTRDRLLRDANAVIVAYESYRLLAAYQPGRAASDLIPESYMDLVNPDATPQPKQSSTLPDVGDVEAVERMAEAIRLETNCGLSLNDTTVFCTDDRLPKDIRYEGECGCKVSAKAALTAMQMGRES